MAKNKLNMTNVTDMLHFFLTADGQT